MKTNYKYKAVHILEPAKQKLQYFCKLNNIKEGKYLSTLIEQELAKNKINFGI